MNRRLLIRVATGATVAALATAGAAVAAGHSHHGPNGSSGPPGLAAAATYLGISADTLRTDLQSGERLAQVANTTSGKSASGLIDALVAAAKSHGVTDPDLTAHITAFVDGTAPPHGGPGWPGRPGGPDLQAAATYLGISAGTLRTDLQSGKTLAQIADATSGKSASGLIDALVAADKTRITAFVNGQLPQHP